jgi:hypothetical protein
MTPSSMLCPEMAELMDYRIGISRKASKALTETTIA